LDRVAQLLELQGKNPFRVQSYRRAAQTVSESQSSLASILNKQGIDGLRQLEGIGPSLSSAITEIIETGRLGLLARLEGQLSPKALLRKLPGIGEKLAERIHSQLGIGTLEELEVAAYDGRLEGIEGLGDRRLQGIRDALGGMLSRVASRRSRRRARAGAERTDTSGDRSDGKNGPPVSLLLDVDATYRRKAEAGQLKQVAPHRFNPKRKAWLPIMRGQRKGWRMTVMYSNTQRAHVLQKTRAWVVIYYNDNGANGQVTVVTSQSGPLAGKRVIRGKEQACRRYYS
jgi:hypothetical protein